MIPLIHKHDESTNGKDQVLLFSYRLLMDLAIGVNNSYVYIYIYI